MNKYNARYWKLNYLFKFGIKIPYNKSQGYPGAVELQKMLNDLLVANPNHRYTIDLLNMKKPKRVWEALTGQYETGGKLTNNDYIEKIKKFLLWRTVGPEEFTYINNFKVNE